MRDTISKGGHIKTVYLKNEKNIKNRIWYAFNEGIFPKIEIVPIKGTNLRQFVFQIPIHKFTIKESINSETGLMKKQFKNPNLYPKWNLYYAGNNLAKDTHSIYRLLTDTLLEYQPLLIFKNRKINMFTHLQNIEYQRYNNGNKYYLKLYVEFTKPRYKLPKIIKNVKIIIKAKLLPKDKYVFGSCGKLNGQFVKCYDEEYLSNGGGLASSVFGEQYCYTYPLSKGNPNILCAFATGT